MVMDVVGKAAYEFYTIIKLLNVKLNPNKYFSFSKLSICALVSSKEVVILSRFCYKKSRGDWNLL